MQPDGIIGDGYAGEAVWSPNEKYNETTRFYVKGTDLYSIQRRTIQRETKLGPGYNPDVWSWQ